MRRGPDAICSPSLLILGGEDADEPEDTDLLWTSLPQFLPELRIYHPGLLVFSLRAYVWIHADMAFFLLIFVNSPPILP